MGASLLAGLGRVGRKREIEPSPRSMAGRDGQGYGSVGPVGLEGGRGVDAALGALGSQAWRGLGCGERCGVDWMDGLALGRGFLSLGAAAGAAGAERLDGAGGLAAAGSVDGAGKLAA